MNKEDVYNWVIKVINSCETFSHWAKCINLINNFNNMYQDDNMSDLLRVEHQFQLQVIQK